jgi:hypothetical protein
MKATISLEKDRIKLKGNKRNIIIPLNLGKENHGRNPRKKKLMQENFIKSSKETKMMWSQMLEENCCMVPLVHRSKL